jgi:hypothetical protein
LPFGSKNIEIEIETGRREERDLQEDQRKDSEELKQSDIGTEKHTEIENVNTPAKWNSNRSQPRS